MAMVPSGEGDDERTASSAAAPEFGSWSVGGPTHPTFCFFKGAADGLSGGLMGSVFGFGSGLFKKQGFKGALREGGSSAKTFALLSGVHSIVSCFLIKVRGKEDAWNAGIAGCATGLALSTPAQLCTPYLPLPVSKAGETLAGTPQALAQGCLSFGAFSFVLEYMNRTRPAIAATSQSSQSCTNVENHLHLLHLGLPVLAPFTLPSVSGGLFIPNQEFGRRAKPL